MKKGTAKKIQTAFFTLLITICLLTGCQDIDHLVITLDEEVEPGHYRGEVCAEVNGHTECEPVDLYFPDSIPESDSGIETEPVDRPDGVPESVTEVYVTPSGTKFHWSCWRAQRSDRSAWIPIEDAIADGYTPCSLCLNSDSAAVGGPTTEVE